jgi:hypothetical protein
MLKKYLILMAARQNDKGIKGFLILDCGLQIADFGLRIADCGLRIADCRFRNSGIEEFNSAAIVHLSLIPQSLNSSIP